jgi:hypothetical protein
MFDKIVVQNALKRSWGLENDPGWTSDGLAHGLSSLTSVLIHDIFGGEILKTRYKKGWHFYNRVDGERIDFTRSEMDKPDEGHPFEDLPSSTDETNSYFEQEDYTTFLLKFIRAFEESIGLEIKQPIAVA